MIWKGQELTEDSLLVMKAGDVRGKIIVRAGHRPSEDGPGITHIEFIQKHSNLGNIMYRWPTLFELMEYKNESNLA